MSADPQPAAQAPGPPPGAPGAATPEAFRRGFRWFLVGFALLGLSVGCYAGGSASPVIGVLLPLLFGLVGGAGGFYLAGANLAAADTAQRMRLLGVALTTFLALLFVGSAYGMMLRTGLGLASFVPRAPAAPDRPADLRLDERDGGEALQLVLTRARLKALGASDAEQGAILNGLTRDQTRDAPRGHAEVLLRLAAHMDRVSGAVPRTEGDKVPGELTRLAPYLEAYAKDYRRLAGRIQSGERVGAPLVAYHVATVRGYLDDRLNGLNSGALQYLANHDEVRQPVGELRWALVEEGGRLEASPALDRPHVILEIDRFLATVRGAGPAADAPPADKPKLGPHFAP
jgi:hypothetical protein